MKKILITALIILSFYVIESVVVYFFSVFEGFIQERNLALREDDFRFVGGIIFMRTVFYFIPQLLLFTIYMQTFSNKSLLGITALNTIAFILISVVILGVWTNDLQEYLKRPVFYFFIIGTLLSPLILSSVPYVKSLFSKI